MSSSPAGAATSAEPCCIVDTEPRASPEPCLVCRQGRMGWQQRRGEAEMELQGGWVEQVGMGRDWEVE